MTGSDHPAPWWGRYVGLPFGEAPGEVACWGLVCMVYRDLLGITLPAYGEISAHDLRRISRAMEAGADDGWAVPDRPGPFDVVLMRGPQGGARIVHVGILTEPGQMLHVEAASHAVTVPLDHWSIRARIAGFRRLVRRQA